MRPFYDIIIVHGGSGHLDATYSLNLAPLLKIKDYLFINIFAFKELPPEQAAFYKKRAEMAKKAQLCQDDKCAEITLSSIENSTVLANPKTQELFSSIDTNSPAIWLYSDMEKLKQLQKASPKNQEISKTLPYSTDNILVVVLNN